VVKLIADAAKNKYFCHLPVNKHEHLSIYLFLPSATEVKIAQRTDFINPNCISNLNLRMYTNTINSDKFLDAFNQIEQVLNERFRPGFHVGFAELIRRMQSTDSVIKRFGADLREYAELRNAIVHNRRENFVIAEPHPDIVEEICRIRDLILNPPSIANLPHRDIFRITKQASVKETLITFGKNDFTRCPIVDGNRIIGLLTARSIARWLSSSISQLDELKTANIEQVLPWAIKEKYAIVNSRSRLHDVYELFKAQLRDGGSLQAVIVTKTGRPELPILNIITASDLPMIFTLIDKNQ